MAEKNRVSLQQAVTGIRSFSRDRRRVGAFERFCHEAKSKSIEVREGNRCSGSRSTNLPTPRLCTLGMWQLRDHA